MMKISIEEKSGFCYGVDRVIEMAGLLLERGEVIYSLGQLVHNEEEILRLERKGLKTISHADLEKLHNCKVLIRAHGEPPDTYETAKKNNIELIDGTCPIVQKIQSAIGKLAAESDTLIVIFGKKDHPETKGLFGQAPGKSIIIQTVQEAGELPSSQNMHLYSQTTMDTDTFFVIASILEQKQKAGGGKLKVHNTICGHVSHRKPGLQNFASQNNIVIFVGGSQSSNGKMLFGVCKEVNPKSYYLSSPDELQPQWLEGAESVGIAGATSTPRWQMEQVSGMISEMVDRINQNK